MSDIDLTEWTDAQLEAADFDPRCRAEIQRRKDAGQADDGSKQRVRDFLAANDQAGRSIEQ